MSNFLINSIVGSALGFLAGLGVGGGSILILWLTVVLEMEYTAARMINLLFFIPAALISCCFRGVQGGIKFKQLLPAVISGTMAAIIFAVIGRNIEIEVLKKLFGILLVFTAVKELFYRPRKAR